MTDRVEVIARALVSGQDAGMATIKSEPGWDHTWVDVDGLRTLVRIVARRR